MDIIEIQCTSNSTIKKTRYVGVVRERLNRFNKWEDKQHHYCRLCSGDLKKEEKNIKLFRDKNNIIYSVLPFSPYLHLLKSSYACHITTQQNIWILDNEGKF